MPPARSATDPRSTRGDCAIRSGTPSIRPPTSRGSATSVGPPGRRSTRARAATSAGRATRVAPRAALPRRRAPRPPAWSSGSFAFSTDTTAACNALYAQGLAAVRPPVFAWNHDGFDGYGLEGGAAAIAGSFYTGIVYPPEYQDALFFMDFNRRWLRYLTFDAQGHATVHNFGRDSTDGIVAVLQGPDTNLYVVTISTSSSEIRRIRYLGAGNTPPTAVAGATPTIGEVPLTVQFSSQGTFDPDAQPLGYSWDFGDGSAPATGANPTHVYQSGGSFTVTLTVTEQTAPFAARTAQLVVTVGSTPPLATITAAGRRQHVSDRRCRHVQRVRHVRRRPATARRALLGSAAAPQRAHPLQRPPGRLQRLVHRHRARRQHVLRDLPDGDGHADDRRHPMRRRSAAYRRHHARHQPGWPPHQLRGRGRARRLLR